MGLWNARRAARSGARPHLKEREMTMTDQEDAKKPDEAKGEQQGQSARERFMSPTQSKLLQAGIDSLKKNGAAYDNLKNR